MYAIETQRPLVLLHCLEYCTELNLKHPTSTQELFRKED